MNAGEVGGQVLAAGLVDEVAMDVVPVVFGSGKRYFGSIDQQHLLEGPDVVIWGRPGPAMSPRASSEPSAADRCSAVPGSAALSSGVGVLGAAQPQSGPVLGDLVGVGVVEPHSVSRGALRWLSLFIPAASASTS